MLTVDQQDGSEQHAHLAAISTTVGSQNQHKSTVAAAEPLRYLPLPFATTRRDADT